MMTDGFSEEEGSDRLTTGRTFRQDNPHALFSKAASSGTAVAHPFSKAAQQSN
jgi:hypothetical protein